MRARWASPSPRVTINVLTGSRTHLYMHTRRSGENESAREKYTPIQQQQQQQRGATRPFADSRARHICQNISSRK